MSKHVACGKKDTGKKAEQKADAVCAEIFESASDHAVKAAPKKRTAQYERKNGKKSK